jgi:hypothetical protein
MLGSEALVIRPNMPNPINRIPNISETQEILGHNTVKMQLNRLRRGSVVKSKSPVPPIAYTMMGHGYEEKGTNTVPPGCVLVIASKAGEEVYSANTIENNLKFISHENRQYIFEPLKYKKEIHRLFGPVTIFTEGDIYPSLTYSLLGIYPNQKLKDASKNTVRKYTAFKTSGVTRIESDEFREAGLMRTLSKDYEYMRDFDKGVMPLWRESFSFRVFGDHVLRTPFLLLDGIVPDRNMMKTIKTMSSDEKESAYGSIPTQLNPLAERIIRSINLPELFRFSNAIVSRTALYSYLETDLADYKTVRPRPHSVYMDVQDYIEDMFLEDNLIFTQTELFQKGGPGVYYNFVCRTMEDELNNTPNPFKLKASNLQRISEAVTHRKAFFKNVLSGAGRKTYRKGKTCKSKGTTRNSIYH